MAVLLSAKTWIFSIFAVLMFLAIAPGFSAGIVLPTGRECSRNMAAKVSCALQTWNIFVLDLLLLLVRLRVSQITSPACFACLRRHGATDVLLLQVDGCRRAGSSRSNRTQMSCACVDQLDCKNSTSHFMTTPACCQDTLIPYMSKGFCVDLNSDQDFCGSCSERCNEYEDCCDGKCTVVYNDNLNCGTCGVKCQEHEVCKTFVTAEDLDHNGFPTCVPLKYA